MKIYGGHFEPDKKVNRIRELQQEMNEPNFWNDKKRSESIIGEFNELQNALNSLKELKEDIKNNIDMIELLKNENDEEIKDLVISNIELIKERLKEQKVKIYLNGIYDREVKPVINNYLQEENTTVEK